jgi:hypothetical protein
VGDTQWCATRITSVWMASHWTGIRVHRSSESCKFVCSMLSSKRKRETDVCAMNLYIVFAHLWTLEEDLKAH